MELHIPASTQTIWVDTIVRYVVVHRRTGRCGLEFLSLTEDQRSVIKSYCRLQPLKKRWLSTLVPPVGSAPETGGKGRTRKTWGRVLDVMPLPAFALAL
jgi:hypothetical protein